MKFEEALKLLRAGKKVRKPEWEKGTYIYMTSMGFLKNEKDVIATISYIDVDWEEYREPLLNDFEKDMLDDICYYYNKFKETSVERVRKIPSLTKSDTEFVRLYLNTMEIDDFLDTPHFEKGTMFKKLELGKYYKIEELELEQRGD